jgi:uncharacterized membrane protein YphA (DoxX/SURF4 family)
MASWIKARDVPGRVSSGAYILHAGLQKWSADEDRATAIHGMAAAAFPVLKDVPPARFVRMLAAGEIGTGALLLTPFVSTAKAGAALTAFSGALLAMYWRTPALHEPGSIWPTAAGTAVSKDVWMFGMGLGFLLDGAGRRRRRSADSAS